MNLFYGEEKKDNDGLVVDTTFVLLFLAIEFGRSFQIVALDSGFLALTLAGIIIMPYFLASDSKISVWHWTVGRSLIAVFGAALGWLFKQSLGVVLPETFRFLPLTLLILTAMFSCYFQFYSFLKFRLAK